MLAYLAFRAGSGRVWGYSLKQIAAEVEPKVVEKTVRRAVDKFQAQGIIAIKRHGPKASEYTVHFEVDPAAKSGHFRI